MVRGYIRWFSGESHLCHGGCGTHSGQHTAVVGAVAVIVDVIVELVEEE